MADNDQGWRSWALNNAARMEANIGATLPAAPANQPPLSFGGVPGGPDFDAIELLPGAAQDRLRKLRLRSKDAHAVSVPFEDVRQASMERVTAEQALTRLVSHPPSGMNLPPDHASVLEAQRNLDKRSADFERLKQLQEVRTAAWQTVSQTTTACEDWLRTGRPHGTVLEAVEVEEPKLAKGETVIDSIERHRRRVRELKADLHRIASAPYPSSHAKAQMRAQIEQLVQAGTPDVSLLIEHDREIIWPTRLMQSTVYNAQPGAVASAEVPDTVALFAWLHRDALIARLDAEINSESDDPAALTHEARQQREAEGMGDLLDIERQEASLVWRAIDDRLPVEHRSDCSPLAILQIRLVTAPRSINGPTSPDHAYNIVPAGLRR